MTLGGAPNREERPLKSPSFDTIVKPCRLAYAQTAESSAPSADGNQSPLAISGERETGPDVFARQVRKVTEEVVFGHADAR